MSIYQYSNQQTELLAQRDPKLGAFIERKGFVERQISDDFFTGLCYNIVGQQLSMKACATLWNRFTAEVGGVIPANCLDPVRLKNCGLSRSKAECISRCAERYISGGISEQSLSAMTDEEVISALTEIKGIGRWTAEMVLIFCLAREDVLSLSDYGIRKGLSRLHGLDMSDRKSMQRYKEIYSPCGTVASIYLWEAARETEV